MIRVMILAATALGGVPALAQSDPATPIADITRGSQVTVTGTVERIVDADEFHLADQSGSIEVYLGPSRIPVVVGEVVTVTGYVDDDPGPPDLCASRITKADGTVVPIPDCDG